MLAFVFELAVGGVCVCDGVLVLVGVCERV